MKIRNLYALTASAMMVMVLGACTSEEAVSDGVETSPGGENTSFTISLNNGKNAQTRSAELGATGTQASETREAKLNKVYAVAFLNGKYYGTFEGTQPADPVGSDDEKGTTYAGTTDYRFDFKKIGSYKVYIVTNVNGVLNAVASGSGFDCSSSTLAVKTIADFTAGTSEPADLFASVIDQTPGDDNTADNFIMTSEEQTVNIDATKIKNQGNIEVERAAARFDVAVNTDNTTSTDMNANVGSETSNFLMTKITFKNRYTKTLMARDASSNTDMTTVATRTNTQYDQTAGGAVSGTTSCTATIYGYENYNDLAAVSPDAYTDGVTVFNIQGIYKRGENDKLEVDYDIPFIDENGDVIPIERNHIYKVNLLRKENTPTEFAAMSYTITVVDWATGETLKVTHGDLKDEIAPTVAKVEYGTTPTTVTANSSGNYEIPAAETSVTITTETTSKAAVKLVTDNYKVVLYDKNGVAITGIEITEDTTKRVYDENAKLTQVFTVTFPANTSTTDDVEYQMHLENQFKTSQKVSFKIIHQKATS